MVSDDQVAGALLERVLAGHGHRVVTAADCPAALRCLEHGRPGVLLLDFCQPQWVAWEIWDHRKNDPCLAAIPIVVLSSTAPLAPGQAADLGIAVQLTKPVASEIILQTLSRCLTARVSR
jgi:CheY-like chemotaxis protein